MNYDASVNYGSSPRTSARAKRIGATLLGGMLGMTCYYLPISKDTFVNTAFSVTRKNAENDIKILTQAAEEIHKNKLSDENKIFLRRLGVADTLDAISDKCKALRESVTDPDTVKALKKDFADNFKTYRKDASLMDTVAAKAMSTIKWNGFKWGMGIGAVLGAALSLVATRDN